MDPVTSLSLLALPGQILYALPEEAPAVVQPAEDGADIRWRTARRIVVPGRAPPITPPAPLRLRPPRVRIGAAECVQAPNVIEAHGSVSWQEWNQRAAVLALLVLEA